MEKGQAPTSRKIVRRRGACDSCKQRKVRCNGETPMCSTCQKQEARCTYSDSKRRPNIESVHDFGSPPSTHVSRCLTLSTDIATNASTDYQFLDPQSTANVLDLDAFSSDPASIIVDEISLSGFLPLDIPLFGEGYTWTTDGMDNHNSCWPHHPDLTNPYSLVRCPLEGLFPRIDDTLIWSPAETSTTGQEEEDTYANESSTLASILCSRLHEIADSPHQSSIQTLLQQVAVKALDATVFPAASTKDSSTPILQQPCYERHVVKEYVNAYFNQFHHRFPFIFRDQFESCMDALLTGELAEDDPAVPLVNAVLALGCRLIQKRKTNDTSIIDREARHYHDVALRNQGHLLLGGAQTQASIKAVQALIAMTIYLQHGGHETSHLALSLISTAVQHCLMLKLNRIKNVKRLASSELEYELLQRVFWVVYSLEKPLAMGLGRFSSIDDDLIDFPPQMIQDSSEATTMNQPGLFIHFCEHAKLCSMVVKQLYGIAKSGVRRNDIQEKFHTLDMLLQTWKDAHTSQYENNVELYLRYYELKVTIHHRGKPCVQLAREVLSQAHLLETNAISSDWLIVQVPIMACCMLLIDVFSSSKNRSDDFRTNLAFLGMASGWLGRLVTSSEHNVAFNEIMELIALAHQQCKTS